jgi:hypothetical protein
MLGKALGIIAIPKKIHGRHTIPTDVVYTKR